MKPEEEKLKKREQNLNFIKFLLGTIGLGFLGHFINLEVQRSEIALEVQKTETAYLSTFVNRFMDTKDGERVNFLFFMSKLSQTDDISDKYKDLYKHYNDKYNAINSKKDSLDKEKQKVNPNKLKLATDIEQELNTGFSISTGKELNPREKRKKTAILNTLINDTAFTKANSISKSIQLKTSELNFMNTFKERVNTSFELIWEYNNWMKINYFRVCPSGEYIALNELDIKGLRAEFQLRNSKTKHEKPIGTKMIDLGKTETIITDKFSYEITLTNIGKAGKNPFTKGAYFTIRKMKLPSN